MAVVAGCGGGTTEPGDPSFSLNLSVVDPGGVPVAGLVATLSTPIPEVHLGFAKAVTRIDFFVPVDSVQATMTITSLDGSLRSVYFDQRVLQGSYSLAFATGVLGIERAGTTAYRYELVVTDDGTELFRDAKVMTAYTSADLEQRPRIGTTDANGSLRCRDRNLFPFLFDLGPQPILDDNGDLAGEFSFRDSVVVTLTDTVSNAWRHYPMVLDAGANVFELTWDVALAVKVPPADMSGAATAVPAPGPTRIDPEDSFELRQNFPNPFN